MVKLKNCQIGMKIGVVVDMDPVIMIVVTKKRQKGKKTWRQKDKKTKWQKMQKDKKDKKNTTTKKITTKKTKNTTTKNKNTTTTKPHRPPCPPQELKQGDQSSIYIYIYIFHDFIGSHTKKTVPKMDQIYTSAWVLAKMVTYQFIDFNLYLYIYNAHYFLIIYYNRK